MTKQIKRKKRKIKYERRIGVERTKGDNDGKKVYDMT